MRRKVNPSRGTSKTGPGHLAGKSRPNGRSISPALAMFARTFPRQTAIELALRTGADTRHCERCLAGTRELGSAFQTRLLQSDVGREMLIALMGDAKPKWWVGFRRHLALAELVKTQAQTQASIEAMQRELAE
jgi:hypothetical protein